MKVKINQEHIDNGCYGDTDNCPIALAFCDIGLPVDYAVGVHNLYFVLKQEDVADGCWSVIAQWPIPNQVRERIIYYDKHRLIEPFEFDLPKDMEIQLTSIIEKGAK